MSRDRPLLDSDEIEITPEMIAAGASAVLRSLESAQLYPPMTEEKLATVVFREMLAARPRPQDMSTRR